MKGILTKASVLAALHEKGPEITVAEAMQTEFLTLSPNDMLSEGLVGPLRRACPPGSRLPTPNGAAMGFAAIHSVLTG